MCYSSNTGLEWILNESAQKVYSGGKNSAATPAEPMCV